MASVEDMGFIASMGHMHGCIHPHVHEHMALGVDWFNTIATPTHRWHGKLHASMSHGWICDNKSDCMVGELKIHGGY